MHNSLRPAISMFMVCADPDRADPMAKKASDPTMTGRRPKICARPPDSGKKAVLPRLYAAPTHTYLEA